MPDAHVRDFGSPDEVIEAEGIRSEIVTLGDVAVARTAHQPGWRWSVHVRPMVGTAWCETRHVGLALAGTLRIVLESGAGFVVEAGQVFEIPPGHDGWVEGDVPYESIEWTGVRAWIPGALNERVLTTLLFTDIADSTALAARLGDRAWNDLYTTFEDRARDTLARFRGREVKPTGDGSLAMFDGAARALRCAQALVAVAHRLGVGLRCAVHTGEVEMAASDLRGVAVHEAARILALAGPGEILVSATTQALVGHDPGIRLVDRGEHPLRGVGRRRVFALVG